MSGQLTQFHVEIPEAELRDLRERLERTRWPEEETVEDWSQGVPRVPEGPLRILGREVRLAGDRDAAKRAAAVAHPDRGARHPFPPRPLAARRRLPLIITHGWPGSIVEFLKVIGPLTDPTAHGGDAADAFHIVCPSLPGYGFSDKPTRPGWASNG